MCWHPNIRGTKTKTSGDHAPIFRGTKTKTPQLCLAASLDSAPGTLVVIPDMHETLSKHGSPQSISFIFRYHVYLYGTVELDPSFSHHCTRCIGGPPIRISIRVNESEQIYLRIYLYSHEITDHLSMYVVYVLWAAYHHIRI